MYSSISGHSRHKLSMVKGYTCAYTRRMGGVQVKFDACDIVRIRTRSRINDGLLPSSRKLCCSTSRRTWPHRATRLFYDRRRLDIPILVPYKWTLWRPVRSSPVQNMPTGSLVLLVFRTQLTVAETLFSSPIRINYVTKATRESVQSRCKQWLP
jgi:hypothetical protein